MRTKCYKVKLLDLEEISNKCYLAKDYNGNEDFIPKSQVFKGEYGGVYWISEWILERKSITHSNKSAYFNEFGKMLPEITIRTHTPERVELEGTNDIDELER